MHVEVTAGDPDAIGADLVAVAVGARASELGAPERAIADADPVAIVYTDPAPLTVVALKPDVEGMRTGAARAVRACRGGTVAWALDASLPLPVEEQVRALAEGAVLGGYDARRWRSGEQPRDVQRFVICGCADALAPVADRAALVARWTNAARELVDAPPNVVSPAALAERAAAFPGCGPKPSTPPRRGLARSPLSARAARPCRFFSCSGTNRPARRMHRGWRSLGRPSRRSSCTSSAASARPQREGAGVVAREQHIVTARRAPDKRLAQRHGQLD